MKRERGFATLAAVLVSASFALLAAQVARTSRSGVASVNAGMVHARLAAAAEAGLAIGLDHVLADDPAARWQVDGETYAAPYAGTDLQIRVEDEAGKIPLNRIAEDQVRAMFQLAGADPGTLDALTAAFMARRDPDRARAPGEEDEPNGFRTVQDLRRLPGMTPAVYAAVAPFATVDAGDVRFEPRTASPFALQVMGGGGGAVTAIEQLRAAQGERTAFDTPAPVLLTNRVLTVRVTAADGDGGRVEDATIVQITGRPQQPYIVRQHYGAPDT